MHRVGGTGKGKRSELGQRGLRGRRGRRKFVAWRGEGIVPSIFFDGCCSFGRRFGGFDFTLEIDLDPEMEVLDSKFEPFKIVKDDSNVGDLDRGDSGDGGVMMYE